MPRVLIVCDGGDGVSICYSPTFRDSPEMRQALTVTGWPANGVQLVPTPQSQIDRFDMPGEGS